MAFVLAVAASASAQDTGIAGRVTDESTGAPVLPSWVSIVDVAGLNVASGAVDASGNYRITGLPVGSFYVVTTNEAGYLDELFDDVLCEPSCTTAGGQAVATTAGAITPNVDFQLRREFVIEGRVTEAGTGNALAGVAIDVFNSGPGVRAWSDSAGNYRVGGLTAGTHFVRTDNALGYLDKLFDNLPCEPSCTPASGTPVTGTFGDRRTADFVLERGGTVTGRVTNQTGGAPLGNVPVQIFDAIGTWITTALTDQDGNYAAIGLATGSYRARTASTTGFVDKLFDNILCLGTCNVASGKAIQVTAGSTTSNVNFALLLGGEIRGRVTQQGGGGIPNATVVAYREDDKRAFSAVTDATGNYRIRGLPTAYYFVATSNGVGFRDQVYPGVPCYLTPCALDNGEPMDVSYGQTVTGIDFALTPLGSVTGRIVNDQTKAGIAGVQVDVFNLNGVRVSSAMTDQSGNYTALGLSSGLFYARTINDLGFIDQLYKGFDCQGCNVKQGTQIGVTEGRATTQIGFSLREGGRVTGIVRDSGTMAPLANLPVDLYSATGTAIRQVLTSATGAYEFKGLLSGSYRVTVNGDPLGYSSELFDDILCSPACTIANGTPVAVAEGVESSGIDFLLDKLGSISGVVRNEATGQGINGVTVKIANATGATVGQAQTNAAGAWSVLNLRPGQYFAFTDAGAAFVNEVFDNVQCQAACAPASGTPIGVQSGEAVTGIDFALVARVIPPTCATDVTNLVEISRGGFRVNAAGQYVQNVEMISLADEGIVGPVRFVLDNLTSNVTLTNASGTTSCASPLGSPFIIVDTDTIFDFDDTAVVQLRFSNPQKKTITYKVRVLAGPNQP